LKSLFQNTESDRIAGIWNFQLAACHDGGSQKAPGPYLSGKLSALKK
jgi:hypothetical protein